MTMNKYVCMFRYRNGKRWQCSMRRGRANRFKRVCIHDCANCEVREVMRNAVQNG